MFAWPLLLAVRNELDIPSLISRVKDPEIRRGLDAAINKNLIPAATQEYYPGFFNITADGGAYGDGASWPGLDSWQMGGAYLLLGRRQMVLDYFEFVKASQRKDGMIPFAIFTGDTRAEGCFNGLKTPDDIFTYTPPKREGVPASAQQPRQWIGLFKHWLAKENSLAALGPVCYILSASEIYDDTKSKPWLKGHLDSLEATAKYLVNLKSKNGLVAGSGFYVELPPRYQWDGITQCYTIYSFRKLSQLFKANGDRDKAELWKNEADLLQKVFVDTFWRKDHFGEYVHPDHGLVDSHGLTDVNFAAIALGIADSRKSKVLWKLLTNEKAFWLGDKPTQCVSKPFTYEEWELNAPVGFDCFQYNDLAAMGRVWFLDAMASRRMKDDRRLLESTRLVAKMAVDGYWRERYQPQTDGTVLDACAHKYCEYAAVFVRVVLDHPKLFLKDE